MSTLSYGLNIVRKKESGSARPAPAKRKPIFDEDESETEDIAGPESATEIGVIEDTTLPTQSQPHKQNRFLENQPTKGNKAKPLIPQYGDLSSTHSSNRHATDAAAVDPSIYDYDLAFDKIHATSAAKKAADKADAELRKPKYMSNLLAAAEVRKRDQLRAKDKMLTKEREAEGEEFADKEKFVTEAYKTQQAEVARLEEDEKAREEEEAKKRKGQGMMGFYKSVLSRDEKRHEELVAAAAKATENGQENEDLADEPREKNETDIAREINARGGGVIINDEGQVADKRQLLSAGLNIAPKPKASTLARADSSSSAARTGVQSVFQGRGSGQKATRERQTRMMEAQLEQATKRAADDAEDQRLELERSAKSRKTEGDISSAKERYLQRKKEAAAAAGKGG
ncbi:MAG: hypothetical protein M1827_002648 [Pycnora praestabilis]|nr:MAG: hypothetical protein M1827_002648 [Pycnora praestabilis]